VVGQQTRNNRANLFEQLPEASLPDSSCALPHPSSFSWAASLVATEAQ